MSSRKDGASCTRRVLQRKRVAQGVGDKKGGCVKLLADRVVSLRHPYDVITREVKIGVDWVPPVHSKGA